MWDSGDPSAYPTPEGPLPWWGANGVVVPARTDEHVKVVVFDAQADKEPIEAFSTEYTFLSQGTFCVGSGAVTIGNITTASTTTVPISNGTYEVSAYFLGRDPADTAEVAFQLKLIK